MHTDTGTSFEEAIPPNSSSVEEFNIKPCVGMVKSVDRIRARWWHCGATATVCCTCDSAMKPY